MTPEEYANRYLENEIKIIENTDINNILPELTTHEKAIIYKYSEDGYQDLNEKLRISNGVNIPIFGKLLSECLEKLPNFVGNVYRSTNLTDEEYNRYLTAYLKDELIIESFFISTSRSRLIGNQFGNFSFEIFSQTGKCIENISKFYNEKEVVIKYNTSFRVISIDEINRQIQLIEI
jgi:ADP-ribosyltransferase exoenzyme